MTPPKEKAEELIDKMSFETHKHNAISVSYTHLTLPTSP
jgi:hypothetical protein